MLFWLGWVCPLKEDTASIREQAAHAELDS